MNDSREDAERIALVPAHECMRVRDRKTYWKSGYAPVYLADFLRTFSLFPVTRSRAIRENRVARCRRCHRRRRRRRIVYTRVYACRTTPDFLAK